MLDKDLESVSGVNIQEKCSRIEAFHVRRVDGSIFCVIFTVGAILVLMKTDIVKSAISGIGKYIYHLCFHLNVYFIGLNIICFCIYSNAMHLFYFFLNQNYKVEYYIKLCIIYSGDIIFFLHLKHPGSSSFCIHLSCQRKELCSNCLKMKTAGN